MNNQKDVSPTKVKGFGLGLRREPLSPIERELRTEIVDSTRYPTLDQYRGYFIAIKSGSNQTVGVYRGFTSDGAYIFQPSITANGGRWFDNAGRPNERQVWCNRPQFNYGSVDNFNFPNKEFLEAAAGEFDSVSRDGKIYVEMKKRRRARLSK